MQLAEVPSELCPNCGNYVSSLNDLTGFCASCSNGVGGLSEKTPTPKKLRLELWLQENADTIEDIMLTENIAAKDAIRLIAQDEKPTCQVCGNEMPHATPGRHIICTKNPECRKARRYYRYLVYEKGRPKEEALKVTLEKFEQ